MFSVGQGMEGEEVWFFAFANSAGFPAVSGYA